jgi:hypothetical protein
MTLKSHDVVLSSTEFGLPLHEITCDHRQICLVSLFWDVGSNECAELVYLTEFFNRGLTPITTKNPFLQFGVQRPRCEKRALREIRFQVEREKIATFIWFTMCTFMYLYVYVSVRLCICTFMYLYVYVSVRLCICTFMYLYVYVSVTPDPPFASALRLDSIMIALFWAMIALL